MKHRIRDIAIIIFILSAIVAAAWCFAEMTADDRQAMQDFYQGSFARTEIGKMRAERELIHEQKAVVEPEYTNVYDILKSIPEWPEYIELEHDYVVDNGNTEGFWPPQSFVIGKGTRIYFKDRE